MIPTGDSYDDSDVDMTEDMEEAVIPTKTYRINAESKFIQGFVDAETALQQAIYKIIRTEAETYPIYSDNYGAFIEDLIGETPAYATAMVKHRLEEAILMDDRFETVTFDNESYTDGKLSLDITVGIADDSKAINLEGVTIDV